MQPIVRQILRLIQHEASIEWKNRQAITSLLVYALASIYIAWLSFRHTIDPVTWNALFWIIMLFAATNAIARSFLQESRGLQLYYYTLLNPRAVILSKSIYNIVLLSALGLVNLACYALLFESPVIDMPAFLTGLVLGCMGLSCTLTLVSAIVSRAGGNAALVAILGFPLLFPLLITILKFSQNAIDGLGWSVNSPYIIVLICLNGLILTLSYLLFPYLWRD